MQNFGKIKNAFNDLLVESIIKKNNTNKTVFQKYLSTIKENKILKTQFFVYTNIEDKIEPNELKAIQFVEENINLFNNFTPKDISEANLKLVSDVLIEDCEYDKKVLHENISTLISTKKTHSNIDSLLESKAYIVNYIMNNKAKEVNESIDLPPSMVGSLLVDKYNERYSTLDENDRKVLKSIIDSDDIQKKEMYSLILRECIDLIDVKLVESDTEAKDKLLRVKDKLLNDTKELDENFISKISKLVELKDNLKNN